MYGDASKGGLVGREGIQAFILDILAASPPPFAPPENLEHRYDGGTNEKGLDQTPAVRARRVDSVAGEASGGTGVPEPDFEAELEHVLSKMAGVVLAEVSCRYFGEVISFVKMLYPRRPYLCNRGKGTAR